MIYGTPLPLVRQVRRCNHRVCEMPEDPWLLSKVAAALLHHHKLVRYLPNAQAAIRAFRRTARRVDLAAVWIPVRRQAAVVDRHRRD